MVILQTSVDLWSEYVSLECKLAEMICKSMDVFNMEAAKAIKETQEELDRLLDKIINGGNHVKTSPESLQIQANQKASAYSMVSKQRQGFQKRSRKSQNRNGGK